MILELNALIDSPPVQSPLTLVQEIVGDNLLSSYLHGSAVTSGLAPNSDIDLLFFVKNTLEEATRFALIKELLRLSGEIGNREGKRALEVIIFSKEAVMQRTTPVTCDFIYGEWLREDFLKGATSLPFQDFEMTLLLAQAAQEAVLLQGHDNLKNIPNISSLEIVFAIKALAPILLEGLLEDTRNVLLTLARMVRTCESVDFVSKAVAVD